LLFNFTRGGHKNQHVHLTIYFAQPPTED
jgi:hypothetical protein